jgi:hypothetical protein
MSSVLATACFEATLVAVYYCNVFHAVYANISLSSVAAAADCNAVLISGNRHTNSNLAFMKHYVEFATSNLL